MEDTLYIHVSLHGAVHAGTPSAGKQKNKKVGAKTSLATGLTAC